MISAPNLKSLIYYLSSADGISAVFDEKFVLQWTNCDEFFGELDVSRIKAEGPTEETHYRTNYLGESALMTVTPLYRSVRTISAYTITVKNTYQVFKMVSCTSAADHVTMFLKEYEQKTGKLIELNEKISHLVKNGRASELISNQNRILNSINTDMGNYAATVFPGDKSVTLNCNITSLLSSVCKDAETCLKDIKRKLTSELGERFCYLKIDHTLLSAAVAALLNCHLNLSPLKSGINIRASCSEDKFFRVVIKSKSDREGISEQEIMSCNFSRGLAEKIIRNDCGGTFSFTNDGKNATSVFSLSVSLKNKGSLLNAKNSPYLNPEHKPVRHLLRKTIESEIELIEEIKMEASKRKRLDNID